MRKMLIYKLQKSAYASLIRAKGIEEQQLNNMDRENLEPLFTKFTSEFYGTVDYVLYRSIIYTHTQSNFSFMVLL